MYDHRRSPGHLVPPLIGIVGVLLYLPGLGNPPLRVWDEAIYANVARHMVVDGHWLIPHVYWTTAELTPFFQKPPLVMWLQAMSMRLLGTTTFAVRLPVALLTICLAVVVFRIGHELYDWRAGTISGFYLLVAPTIYSFGHSGRSGALDVPLALFGTLFVWWVYRGREQSRFLLPAGLAAAGAVMTKGLAAGVFLVVLTPYVALHARTYVSRATLRAAAVGAVLIALWPTYAWTQHGAAVWEGLVSRQIARGAGKLTRHGEPLFGFMNYPYFQYVATSEMYLLPILAATLFVGWLIAREGASAARSELFLLWWVLSVPLTFTVGGGNHVWYLLPMVPPLTLLLGRMGSALVTVWNDLVCDGWRPLCLSGVRFLLLGLAVTGAFASAFPYLTTTRSVSQQELASAFDEADPDAVIYVEDGAFTLRHYAFAFYVNRPLGSVSQLQVTRDRPQYALVSAATLSEIEREYRILKRRDDAVAIRLAPG